MIWFLVSWLRFQSFCRIVGYLQWFCLVHFWVFPSSQCFYSGLWNVFTSFSMQRLLSDIKDLLRLAFLALIVHSRILSSLYLLAFYSNLILLAFCWLIDIDWDLCNRQASSQAAFLSLTDLAFTLLLLIFYLIIYWTLLFWLRRCMTICLLCLCCYCSSFTIYLSLLVQTNLANSTTVSVGVHVSCVNVSSSATIPENVCDLCSLARISFCFGRSSPSNLLLWIVSGSISMI